MKKGLIGFIGDIHGHYEDLARMLSSYSDVQEWFQVGDLGGKVVYYPPLPSNFHFIQGNHEHWDLLESSKEIRRHFLPNAAEMRLTYGDGPEDVIHVAVLGGNYSPKFYKTKRKDLPQGRRRHYVEEEVQRLVVQAHTVDILLTHETASPYVYNGLDRGQETITSVIKALEPKLHFYGHHHFHKVDKIGTDCKTLSVGLPFGTAGFVLYDAVKDTIATTWLPEKDSTI